MKKMKVGPFRTLGLLALAAVLTLAAGSSLLYLSPEARLVGETQQYLASLSDEIISGTRDVGWQAQKAATKLYADNRARCEDFVNELLELYYEAEDKDFILIYNSGGWGRAPLQDEPPWESVLYGIETKLEELGYTCGLVEYKRSDNTTRESTNELRELVNAYPSKAMELAVMVDFITRYSEDLKVIITGVCHGAVYSNEVTRHLESNPRVYSIQAGRPFWYEGTTAGRTLIIDNNGVSTDTINTGDIWGIIRYNLQRYLGLAESEGIYPNTTPCQAPGHEYAWDYPKVRAQITAFLEENFVSSKLNRVQSGDRID